MGRAKVVSTNIKMLIIRRFDGGESQSEKNLWYRVLLKIMGCLGK
jgi:hypothetical protein